MPFFYIWVLIYITKESSSLVKKKVHLHLFLSVYTLVKLVICIHFVRPAFSWEGNHMDIVKLVLQWRISTPISLRYLYIVYSEFTMASDHKKDAVWWLHVHNIRFYTHIFDSLNYGHISKGDRTFLFNLSQSSFFL